MLVCCSLWGLTPGCSSQSDTGAFFDLGSSPPAEGGSPAVADGSTKDRQGDMAPGDGAPSDSPLDRQPGDSAPESSLRDGPPIDGGVDAGTEWPFAPASYDCTSIAKGPPPRQSTVPLDCVLQPSCTEILVTSHRGMGADSQDVLGFYLPIGKVAPENTLSAIRAAIVIGADFVEIDVRQTLDGQLVLMHDDELDRTMQGSGKIADLTLAQLQALTYKTSQFNGDFNCERIPTFVDALSLAKDRINIVVDLKTEATDKVAQAIANADMLDQAFLSTATIARLELARATVPAVRLHPRTGAAQLLPILLISFTPGPDVVEMEEGILNAATISTVHQGGARVSVDGFIYDIQGQLTNSPQSYAPLVAKNPDIIQVDRSDLLLKYLGR